MDSGSNALYVELDVHVPDDGELVRIGRAWIEGVLDELTPGLRSRLSGQWGRFPHVGVSVLAEAFGRHRRLRYSKEWVAAAAEQLRARPVNVGVQLTLEEGPESPVVVVLISNLDGNSDQRYQLTAYATTRAAVGLNPTDSGDCDRLAEFLTSRAALSTPTFGSVTDDYGNGITALDLLLSRGQVESVQESTEVLRGYSWITVIPAQLVERMGGPGSLVASGAFVSVEPLENGAVVARATETLAEYGEEAMWRVFHALTRVLPTGRPRFSTREDHQLRAVDADAADFR